MTLGVAPLRQQDTPEQMAKKLELARAIVQITTSSLGAHTQGKKRPSPYQMPFARYGGGNSKN